MRTRSIILSIGGGIVASVSLLAVFWASTEIHYLYFDRQGLPDPAPLIRFGFPTIGRIYDARGQTLIALAREQREITRYRDLPPVMRDAILAAEDKRFFSHRGIDYASLPRVLGKVRLGMLLRRLAVGGRHDDVDGAALFPQGGSTITQQLVRATFLRGVTTMENSYELRSTGVWPRLLSSVVGARGVNMLARKREELRLALWLEEEMARRFGSPRRAKEEILARYASLVYLGHGQYGFARAAEYFFGKQLSTFTVLDADKAALLAGITKSPRRYAPSLDRADVVLRRRDQILNLMQASGFLSGEEAAQATGRPLQLQHHEPITLQAPAVVAHVLQELTARHADLGIEDLLQGRIQVNATADVRAQRVVDDALERGLVRYEERHADARGRVQGSVVVLRNRDGQVLAETGGRRVFKGRPASYSDFNRATRSLRQPGSAMKPLVYLAAFQRGGFTLETLVPDLPISVSHGDARAPKWIANYDGRFKGLIPVRQALAESRNAVAIWIIGRVGVDRVLQTSRALGVRTPLARYPTTALGASEMTLLELANAYRAMASGIVADPYVIRAIVGESGDVLSDAWRAPPMPMPGDTGALALIQEGLRGVVRLPTGTAHALAPGAFPIDVMGKTGTTNEFRDAIFVGSTYGPDGITAAVRIGFDDNRSLGSRETGGRVALPVFRDLMLGLYRERLVDAPPVFPAAMEGRVSASLLRVNPPASPDEATADR